MPKPYLIIYIEDRNLEQGEVIYTLNNELEHLVYTTKGEPSLYSKFAIDNPNAIQTLVATSLTTNSKVRLKEKYAGIKFEHNNFSN